MLPMDNDFSQPRTAMSDTTAVVNERFRRVLLKGSIISIIGLTLMATTAMAGAWKTVRNPDLAQGNGVSLPRLLPMHFDRSSPLGRRTEVLSTLVSTPKRTTSGVRRSYVWPVQGYVSSPFGGRWGRMHEGIDIAGPTGSPVVAVQSGQVLFAGWMSGGYGNTVDLRHTDGAVSRYAHLKRISVQRGQILSAGRTLGTRGCSGRCTGPHVHFEVHVGGRQVNPMPYLP